jgi:hypothetical protein
MSIFEMACYKCEHAEEATLGFDDFARAKCRIVGAWIPARKLCGFFEKCEEPVQWVIKEVREPPRVDISAMVELIRRDRAILS